MPELATLTLSFGMALVLAAMPGPGLFYIAGRTLASGWTHGLASPAWVPRSAASVSLCC